MPSKSVGISAMAVNYYRRVVAMMDGSTYHFEVHRLEERHNSTRDSGIKLKSGLKIKKVNLLTGMWESRQVSRRLH